MMENIDKKFGVCPVCGSEGRFFETLSRQLKDLGYAREEWNMSKDFLSGPVIDKVKEKSIPIGKEVPSFEVKTDICLDCGTVYAISLKSGPAKKGVVPPRIIVPGDIAKGGGQFGIPPSGDVRRN